MGQHKSKMARLRSKAAKCRTVRSLKELLSVENVDVNCLFNIDDTRGVTPLWLAVRYNDVELVKLILGVGADVNCPCEGRQMTPLHMACYEHNLDMAQVLLEAGAETNVLDKWNYTPLMYAAIHFEPYTVGELFKLLIRHKADVNYGATLSRERDFDRTNINVDLPELRSTYDGDYITYIREPMGPASGIALHLAVQNPHLPNEIIEILLDEGSEVNKLNLYGQTALMGILLDIYFDYHTHVRNHLALLIAHGASVDVQDIRGWTAMHYAAQRGSISCMSVLMNYNADCNMVSACLESPLWILLAHGWREGVRFLLMSGCNVDQPIRSTTLLTINQDIDICRYGFIFPIEFAVCNRYYQLAELMVQTGCLVTPNTWLGSHLEPPHTRHTEFLHFLEEHKARRGRLLSLADLSRDSLRAALRSNICVKLESIHLPQRLKDFVCFND